MVKILLQGLAIGVGGLALLLPVIYFLNCFDISRDAMVGVLGAGCLAVSLLITVIGLILLFKGNISTFSFLKSFALTGFVVAAIGVWNLINAGWLKVTFIE